MTETIQLFRPKISVMVGLSAFAGACLYDSLLNREHFYAAASAVFLSAGSSALNQYQESREDKLMLRTRRRPVASGAMSGFEAVRLAVFMLALSASMMIMAGSIAGLVFLPFTIMVYNFIYTPMKKISPFALLIGSVTGAIPPVMGYVAVGGSAFSPDIMTVAVVLYIWQTPHFALLSERFSADYRLAGFKTLSSVYGKPKAELFINTWLAAFICALFFIPVSNVYCFQAMSAAHLGTTIVFASAMLCVRKSSTKTFHILNLCMVIFFLMLVVDRIIL
ncbi:UbiA prenyltransferase [Denitrovibrio acetiphilus DSM 12809]|uniref:Protoheme IX farnesyltransferase n=1 Tax=Denitrovibrio acetiphilus (strain DSM 12809 / NBRC 114555 / N2460) TaxID=522772 RepID=D4H6R4_DENA2|nr:protoheme IX farnesyltransferase [Denitrovibrio acetiphilus]ADD67780.1 UbiA prenyltransferase [Denitrovibrio acetiphilus DSM 12809]